MRIARKAGCGNESGAVLAFVASCLVAIMALVALAVDLTLIEIYRLQQQSAADYYAMAAARAMAKGDPPIGTIYDFFATDNQHLLQHGRDTPTLSFGRISSATGGFEAVAAAVGDVPAVQVTLSNSQTTSGLTVMFARIFGADLARTTSIAVAYYKVVGTETVFRLL